MRTKKQGDKASCSAEAGCATWREEILSCAFETYLGISRLIATVQIGPSQSPSTRKKRLPRQGR